MTLEMFIEATKASALYDMIVGLVGSVLFLVPAFFLWRAVVRFEPPRYGDEPILEGVGGVLTTLVGVLFVIGTLMSMGDYFAPRRTAYRSYVVYLQATRAEPVTIVNEKE